MRAYLGQLIGVFQHGHEQRAAYFGIDFQGGIRAQRHHADIAPRPELITLAIERAGEAELQLFWILGVQVQGLFDRKLGRRNRSYFLFDQFVASHA